MNKKHIIYVIIMFFIVVTGVIYVVKNYNSNEELLLEDVMQDDVIISTDDANSDNKNTNSKQDEDKQNKSQLDSKSDSKIYVHVCGAVVKPGVYELDSGDRVVDAIKAAGGFNAKADETCVNQAKVISDSEQIYIPKQGEVNKELGSSNSSTLIAGSNDGKVNINLASKEDLITLPGIGEAKAQKIIDYRTQHGSFLKIEDIMNITGIKEGLFKKISEYITV